MNFIINNHEWQIVEISKEILKQKYEEGTEEKAVEVFGLTNFCEQTIYLNKTMHENLKKHTLMHELLHCYISEYCSIEQNNYNEEVMCDICANSHDIIHEIVKKYFKKKGQ